MAPETVRPKTPYEYLELLCAPPHRVVGSEGERAAAGIAEAEGRAAGGEVAVDRFRAPKDLWPAIAWPAMMSIAAALISWAPGWLRAVVAAQALVGFVLEMSGRTRVFSGFSGTVPSQNVVVRFKSARPGKRIVLTAHLDSPRSALMFHPALVRAVAGRAFPGALTLPALAMALILVGVLAACVGQSESWVSAFLTVGVVVLSVMLLVMIERAVRGKPTNGALDNASGAAVLLSLLPDLAGRAQGAEVWAVFTGAEEVGLRGAFEFAARHGDELPVAETFVVNLESLGLARLGYVASEGGLWPKAAGPRLKAACEKLSKTTHQNVVPSVAPSLTDCLVFLARGYDAITLMAHDERGGLGPYHQVTDVPRAIDPKALEATRAFTLDLVEEIGRGG